MNAQNQQTIEKKHEINIQDTNMANKFESIDDIAKMLREKIKSKKKRKKKIKRTRVAGIRG